MPTWKKSKEYRDKIRKEIISYYGGKCSCCGETEIVFLVIDHINGGGCKERKIRGHGSQFYRWLKKENFPSGYQVLCHNCNFAKRMGECPHKKKQIVI
jgi:hypothetical protein